WFWMPGAGSLLEQLRTPWIFAAAAGILAMVAFNLALGGKQDKRYSITGRAGPPSSGQAPVSSAPGLRQGLLTACAALGIAALALTLFALRQPTLRSVPDD